MERMYLKDGSSIDIATIDGVDGTETRLNLVGEGSAVTATLTPEEEEDLVYLIETGTVRRRCRKCLCTEERACVRVEGEGEEQHIVETCAWAEVNGSESLCTGCVEDAEEKWKSPAQQESDTEKSFAMSEPAST